MSLFHVTPATTLLVIDLQERLASAMDEAAMAHVTRQTCTLIELAKTFGAATIASEQYPKGLGPTVAPVRAALGEDATIVEKTRFDLTLAPSFEDFLPILGARVVITGMEAHICVLTTARSLLARGHEVLVPFDAVISRQPAYRDNGLEQLRALGATIVNTETIVFDTLRDAKHPEFKKFSKLIA